VQRAQLVAAVTRSTSVATAVPALLTARSGCPTATLKMPLAAAKEERRDATFERLLVLKTINERASYRRAVVPTPR
jgi:hypothetical protein